MLVLDVSNLVHDLCGWALQNVHYITSIPTAKETLFACSIMAKTIFMIILVNIAINSYLTQLLINCGS